MLFSRDIGIDLGTASILVFTKGKGIVLREPSVVAVDKSTNKVLKVGLEAQKMLGRTPGNIIAIRPLRGGVISDYEMTERMIKDFIRRVIGGFSLFKPRIVICVPSGITEVEERAVIDAGRQAGARAVYLIEEPIAAAMGAGIDITKPDGRMIVDIGGGTTDVAIISLSNIVESDSVKIAGDAFDEAIIKYIEAKGYGVYYRNKGQNGSSTAYITITRDGSTKATWKDDLSKMFNDVSLYALRVLERY